MKKIHIYILLSLTLAALFVLWRFFFYNVIWGAEEGAFFVNTKEYFSIAFNKENSLALLTNNFLSQFYKIFWLGALIQSLVPTLFLFNTLYILKKVSRSSYS